MTNADANHFDEYRPQTQLKHKVLAGYLPAYFAILRNWFSSLRYVDGFAGCGVYTDSKTNQEHPGSPLLVLSLLAGSPKYGSVIECVFIENRHDHFSQLSRVVSSFCAEHPTLPKPKLLEGKFAECLSGVLAEDASREFKPTFLFVDPCGVDGTAFSLTSAVLRRPGCELFMFFNSAGIERVIGVAKKSGASKTLTGLYGSEERVNLLLQDLEATRSAIEVEETSLRHYIRALKEVGMATHILPYRIEAESRRDTSHYLIHASKNKVGFRIMKHVMIEMVGKTTGKEGPLEFRQASDRDSGSTFRFDLAELRGRVLDRLRVRPAQVAEFYFEWTEHPDDPYSEAAYRRLLLQLEEEKLILVSKDEQGLFPHPAEARWRKKRGVDQRELTLGENNWLRLVR